MPNFTDTYRLKKPLGSENFNIEDFNENADKIENGLQEVKALALRNNLTLEDLENLLVFSDKINAQYFQMHTPDYFATQEDLNRLKAKIEALENRLNNFLRERYEETESQVKQIWAALFGQLTANPFSITFYNLDGIVLENGNFNENMAWLEC